MSKYEKNMWRKDMDKKLISKIYINDNKAYSDSALTKLLTDDVVNLCIELCGIGADGIVLIKPSYKTAQSSNTLESLLPIFAIKVSCLSETMPTIRTSLT